MLGETSCRIRQTFLKKITAALLELYRAAVISFTNIKAPLSGLQELLADVRGCKCNQSP